jgi:ubiquitin-protein ligase
VLLGIPTDRLDLHHINFMQGENRRLQKEWEEICKMNQSVDRYAVTAQIVGDDLKHWKGVIRGPVRYI